MLSKFVMRFLLVPRAPCVHDAWLQAASTPTSSPEGLRSAAYSATIDSLHLDRPRNKKNPYRVRFAEDLEDVVPAAPVCNKVENNDPKCRECSPSSFLRGTSPDSASDSCTTKMPCKEQPVGAVPGPVPSPSCQTCPAGTASSPASDAQSNSTSSPAKPRWSDMCCNDSEEEEMARAEMGIYDPALWCRQVKAAALSEEMQTSSSSSSATADDNNRPAAPTADEVEQKISSSASSPSSSERSPLVQKEIRKEQKKLYQQKNRTIDRRMRRQRSKWSRSVSGGEASASSASTPGRSSCGSGGASSSSGRNRSSGFFFDYEELETESPAACRDHEQASAVRRQQDNSVPLDASSCCSSGTEETTGTCFTTEDCGSCGTTTACCYGTDVEADVDSSDSDHELSDAGATDLSGCESPYDWDNPSRVDSAWLAGQRRQAKPRRELPVVLNLQQEVPGNAPVVVDGAHDHEQGKQAVQPSQELVPDSSAHDATNTNLSKERREPRRKRTVGSRAHAESRAHGNKKYYPNFYEEEEQQAAICRELEFESRNRNPRAEKCRELETQLSAVRSTQGAARQSLVSEMNEVAALLQAAKTNPSPALLASLTDERRNGNIKAVLPPHIRARINGTPSSRR
ncbi:unnamed protein product [Amoebophrya sp. A120]|nr:unnamed protein product [Amoebophrya sp. A120]|eukprot:GSA120T00013480001.1